MKYGFNTLIVLNIIACLFTFIIGSSILAAIAVINLCCCFWLKMQEIDDLVEKKNYLLALGIIDFLSFKYICSVVSFIMYFTLKSDYKKKEEVKHKKPVVKVDPQIRKIDILLKLGVAMVFIAGFVFATTGWYSLNSIIKIFIFLIIGLAFIGLSKFSEKHIKIKSTIYLYWILGMSFLVMMFFIGGYSSLFGDFFSFNGEGSLLYLSFCNLIISLVGYISYYNFKDKLFLNITYIGIFFIALFVSQYYNLLFESFLALILPVITVIRYISDETNDKYSISFFCNVLLCILGIVYICFIGTYTSLIPALITSTLFIFNLYNYIYIYKDSDFNLFASLVAYVLIIPVLVFVVNNITIWVIITTLFVTGLYFISLLFNNYKLKNSSLIIADIITILVFVISSSGNVWLPLVVASFSTLICLVCTFIDKLDDFSFEVSIHPVKIAMLLFGIIYLINSYVPLSNIMGYWMCSCLLIYILIYSLSKNNTLINIYEKFSIVAIIICLLFTTTINNMIISITIFISIVLFYADVNWGKERTTTFKNFVYILLLSNIYISMHAIENSFISYQLGMDVSYIFANVVTIIFYGLISFFHRNDEFKLNIALFAVIVPIITLIETWVDVEWISIILPSIFVYYLTFILSRLARKSLGLKDAIGYIGYTYSFLLVIFNSDPHVLAYSFIILIISLLIGYLDKSYNALFKVSVLGTIIFVLYQLKEFWNLIPAWLYLLVFGIALIVFATYKQLKLVEKNEKDGKK